MLGMLLTLALAVGLQEGPAKSGGAGEALRLQVMLDRAGFSPGVIDGRMGPSTRRALDTFRKAHGGGTPADAPALMAYVITPADASGPFIETIPEDLVEQSKLPALAYTSVLEALAEKFHATPELLRHLNRGATFAEGERIQVPNVEPVAAPVGAEARDQDAKGKKDGGENAEKGEDRATGTSGRPAIEERPDVVVTVSKSSSALTVEDASGRIIFYAPVTTGSENDPLPIGDWKITGVQFTPKFHYNPELFWDADPSHSKAVVPPGPNNPVGMVWIDLDKPHYGLHGTPEPAAIGRSTSHGCVRLTNWDAVKLAGMVKPGTRVRFVS
jgi:lipoprotein-anchoring transpeptidase ErfK/SrfK